MGALRTINHPGIEIREYDLSDYAATVGGTTSLVIGFSPQGQAGVPVIPTSTSSVKSYFGTPKTEAERYFFYACKEVFDKGGNLIAARIPYNNNAQYLTPAVTYDIETWQTTHKKEYGPAFQVTSASFKNTIINSTNVANVFPDGSTTKSKLYKTSTKTFTVYEGENAETKHEVTAISTFSYLSILHSCEFSTNSSALTSKITFDDSVLRKTQTKKETYTFTYSIPVTSTKETDTETVTGWDTANASWYLNNVKVNDLSKYGIKIDSLDTDNDESFSNGDIIHIVCDFKTVELDCSGEKFYRIDLTETGKVNSKSITEALKDPSYFTISYWEDKKLWYRETEITDDSIIKGCIYNPVKQGGVNYPQLAVVEKYNDTSHEDVVGVKSYYLDGEGAIYPYCISTDFIQYNLTEEGKKVLDSVGIHEKEGEDYTAEEIVANVKYLTSKDFFTLSNCEFVATVENEVVSLNKSFRAAPVSSDVTSGFDVSQNLAIPALDETIAWSEASSNYPSIIAADPFEDGNYRYVASSIPGLTSYSYSKDDFYEFSSAFTTISGVAYAGSQNYQWIHWKTCAISADTSNAETSAYIDNSIMMSALAGMEQKDVPQGIADIENLVTIKPNTDHFGFIPLSTFQDYRDGAKTPDENKIVICNITEQQFASDDYNNSGMECLGIMPILIGGLQAIPKQQIIQLPTNVGNGRIFNAVESVVRCNLYDINIPESDGINIKYAKLNNDGFYKSVATTDSFAPYDSNISNDILGSVPNIQLNNDLQPDGVQKNCVTLVVCELAISKSFDNKVYVNVLEKFTGSLDKNAVDEQKKSIFIDNIVNSEDSGSSYVRIFSNFTYSDNFKESSSRSQSEYTYINEQTNDNTATVVVPDSLGSDLWFTKDKESMSLGFGSEQTKKYIAYSTIAATLESIFDTLSNVDENVIDVVVDAGLSTIANRIKRICDNDPDVLKAEYAPFYEKIKDVDAIAGWKSICAKYITFCSSTRKDCMAVVDAPRNLSVYNDVKLIKNTKYSIDFDIMPSLTYLAGLNSSYCAQYANWISYVDDFSGKTIWLPPSIMANGSIIYTDYNAQYFDAPAGTKRGLITAGIDVSFNPNARQQDNLYGKSWNYCINSTSDGIVIWGQKTSQTRTSAFDRINVRRLFLRLERLTRNAVKTFLFEGNTEKLRNRVIDMLTPIYENCKTNGGLYDYKIICDSTNNTDSSIDNNELRIAILLKPVKTAEFLILDFYALSTGMDFSEVYSYL